MTIEERIEALTMNLELVSRDMLTLRDMAKQDGENIRGLARIVEAHQERLEQMANEADAREKRLDKRIGDLVSGIGEFIRRTSNGAPTTKRRAPKKGK